MINEGIENTKVQFAAETNPFRLKKFLKNHLLSSGIKVREKESMQRRNKGIMGRETTHDNDLFDGITFSTHSSNNIHIQAKGNKIITKIGETSSSTSMGDMTVKELGDFIVKSYKESLQQEKSNAIPASIDDVVKKLNTEMGDKYNITSDRNHYRHEIYMRINLHKFEAPSSNNKSKMKEIIVRLLDDPVVKRSVDQKYKNLKSDSLYNVSSTMYILPYIKDEVFEAIDQFVKELFKENVPVVRAEFDDRNYSFVITMPRSDPRDQKKLKAPKEYKKENEAKRSLKRSFINSISYLNKKHDKIMEIASQSSRVIWKRFFKDPEKYL